MNFEIPRILYRTEHEIFREGVAKFPLDEVLSHYEKWEDEGCTPLEIWCRVREFGILGTSMVK